MTQTQYQQAQKAHEEAVCAAGRGTQVIDWTEMGRQARQSAMYAHNGELPGIDIAYSFFSDNPECFGFTVWPEIPEEPNAEFVAGYYGADERPHASDCAHWVGEPCDCVTGKGAR